MTALNALQFRLEDNDPTERAAAFRTVLKRTTTADEEDQVLFMAGLHYKPEGSRDRIGGHTRLAVNQTRPEP